MVASNWSKMAEANCASLKFCLATGAHLHLARPQGTSLQSLQTSLLARGITAALVNYSIDVALSDNNCSEFQYTQQNTGFLL